MGGPGRVDHVVSGGGDQQGGGGAGDQLWQELDCGCMGCVSRFWHVTFSVKIGSAK